MATKKLIIDIGGKIKEIASSSVNYDDVNKKITVDKLLFSSASVAIPDGLLVIGADGLVSSSAGSSDGDIVSWDTANNKWVVRPELTDITNLSPSGDLAGSTFSTALVKSLSNVTTGTLSVSNGGTGISKADIISLGTASALLVGNGTSPMSMIKSSDVGDLSKKPFLAANSTENAWTYLTQSSLQTNVDVQIFTSSATWTKPANTKMIRVIAAGAGGGGGSGANRQIAQNCLGGAGGGGGQIIDSNIIFIDHSINQIGVEIGSGGLGGLFPSVGSNGAFGGNGGSTYVSIDGLTTITASGGSGGAGGNINSVVTSSGGAGGSSGVRNFYDNFIYNSLDSSTAGYSGVNNSLTTLDSTNMYASSNPGGGSGAGLSLTSIVTNYRGGSSIPYNLGTIQTIPRLFQFNNSLVESYAGGSFGNFGVQFDSNIKKFGTHSAYFNGSSYLNGAGNNFVAIWSSENSYFECWIRPEEIINNMTLWEFSIGTKLRILSGGKLQLSIGGSTLTSLNSISANKWTHICVSTTTAKLVRLFINGTLEASTTTATTYDAYVGFNLGRSWAGTEYYKGHVDQFVMYRNIGYGITSNFIPSPVPYELNGATISSINAITIGSASLLDYYNISSANISNNSQAFDMFKYSGGPGGASATVTSSYDLETLSLFHANTLNGLKDNSIYSRSMITGSYSSIISSPVGLPSALMSDGVLSCSYDAVTTNLYTGSCKIINAVTTLGTGSFTYEGWYYLINTGSNANVSERCDLASLETAANTSSYGLSISGSGELWLWDQTAIRPTGLMMTGSRLNSWNHIAVVRTGTTSATVYVNATASSPITITSRTISGSVFIGSNNNSFNPNGYIKEFVVTARAKSLPEIQNYYNNIINNSSGSYRDASSYPGGLGANSEWGSGGGGGGASMNYTGAQTRQGGNGGNGYAVIISYKDF